MGDCEKVSIPQSFVYQHQDTGNPAHKNFGRDLEIELTLCMLGNFACFFVVCGFFFKINFSKKSLRNTIRVSNSLDPDQAERFVGPDILSGLIWVQTVCKDYQQTSKVETSRERVNLYLSLVLSRQSWQITNG